MFDQSFKASEQYFTVLQLLRIFDEAIRKPSQILKDLWSWLRNMPMFPHYDWPVDMDPGDEDYLYEHECREFERIRAQYEKIWNDKIWDKHTKQEQKFLERIERKQNEIIGLRDGVSHLPSMPMKTKHSQNDIPLHLPTRNQLYQTFNPALY